MIRFTDEERQFLEQYIPGHRHRETAKVFSEQFRLVTYEQVKAFSKNNHVRSGFRGSEGLPSWNKGKKYKQTGRAIQTQYKKGNIPHNWRPVGSERIQEDGYMMVKVAEPKTWILKQHYVWQQVHGPIDKDEIIVFLDGNRQNCNINNLRKVKRRIHGVINHLHLTYCDEQTFETACALAMLSMATREAKRRRKKHD